MDHKSWFLNDALKEVDEFARIGLYMWPAEFPELSDAELDALYRQYLEDAEKAKTKKKELTARIRAKSVDLYILARGMRSMLRTIDTAENPWELVAAAYCLGQSKGFIRKRPVNPTFSHPSVHGMLITDIQVL